MASLDPAPGTTIHYRQVQLMRGTLPLAMAENWYVPQRLTAAMNDRLQTTNAPFGTVVAPLHPCRRTLVAKPWPLAGKPVGNPPWFGGQAHQPLPEIVLEHKAIILSGSGTSLALVNEFFFTELVSFTLTTLPYTRTTECEA
jgi:hypothetical protein